MKVENCSSYELKEKQEIKELNSICYLLEHKRTKAKVALKMMTIIRSLRLDFVRRQRTPRE